VRAKHEEQRRARELRLRGASLRKIASELDVALSSVSMWVRDVETVTDALRRSGAMPIDQISAQRLPHWTSGAVRRCYRCERTLPDVLFGAAKKRQYRCRSCSRDYFADRGDLHRRQTEDRPVRDRVWKLPSAPDRREGRALSVPVRAAWA